jgi:hypothetical protein
LRSYEGRNQDELFSRICGNIAAGLTPGQKYWINNHVAIALTARSIELRSKIETLGRKIRSRNKR